MGIHDMWGLAMGRIGFLRRALLVGSLRAALALAVVAATLVSVPSVVLAQDDDDRPPPQADDEVNLVVGENKTVSAVGVKNYSVGAKGIAGIKLTSDGSKFVVVGKKAGQTTLLLIYKDGSQRSYVINVFLRSPDAVRREVEDLVRGMPGVRLRRVGARFFIEGGVSTEGQLKRIERVAALYPGQVESLVIVGSAPAQKKVNIRVDFFFVQYDKTSGYAVGIDWPGRIGGDTVQSQVTFDFMRSTTTTATATVANQPLPALDIAANNGWAKVLKQSTVITQNGVEAFFDSGGEQNFAVAASQLLGAQLQPVTFGTKVKVLPRLDPKSGEIEVAIDAEVADLIPPVAGTQIPGRSVTKLKTLVRMRLGQSIVLSGIRSTAERHRINGLPFISQIPVLGLFFGSHSNEREDVEGAVFIIPTAQDTPRRPAIDMVSEAVRQFENYGGNLRDSQKTNLFNKRPKVWNKAP